MSHSDRSGAFCERQRNRRLPCYRLATAEGVLRIVRDVFFRGLPTYVVISKLRRRSLLFASPHVGILWYLGLECKLVFGPVWGFGDVSSRDGCGTFAEPQAAVFLLHHAERGLFFSSRGA